MQKLTLAGFMLLFFAVLQTNAFAMNFKCEFKAEKLEGIDSIAMADGNLVINDQVNIAVEESRIRCANFGRKERYDGNDGDIQVVLKTCTSEAAMEGHLIDLRTQKAAEVFCDKL